MLHNSTKKEDINNPKNAPKERELENTSVNFDELDGKIVENCLLLCGSTVQMVNIKPDFGGFFLLLLLIPYYCFEVLLTDNIFISGIRHTDLVFVCNAK